MGLLDDFSEFAKTPEGQGLLSAVAGGMAGARRGAPINSLGIAGLSGLKGYSNAVEQGVQMEDRKVAQQYRGAQMQQMTEAARRQQEQDAAKARALAVLPAEQRQAVDAGLPFAELWKRNNPETKYQTVDNSLLRINGDSVMPIFKGEKKAPEGFEYIDGNLTPIQAYWDQKKAVAGAGKSATPYFQFLPTPEGIVAGDARTGSLSRPMLNGAPVVKSADSPELQAGITGAKEVAKVTAKTQTEAAFDAPRVVQNADLAIKQSEELLAHPGFKQAVGASSMLGIQHIPGTEAKDFMSRLDQIKGGAFLEAFNSLKGGGQITEVEGKKATDALARMNNATSEKEFTQAVRDYQGVVRAGMNRAKMRAGNRAPQPFAPAQGGAKFLGFE